MGRLLVGLPALRGKLERYAMRFDLVELRPVDTTLPPASRLAGWRKKVPPSFAFSVVLPRAVAELAPPAAFDAALEPALEAATALQARCIVLATTPAVRPTPPNRRRIVELGRRLAGRGHVLAWHAAGIWGPEEVLPTAAEGEWLPVFDPVQQELPPGPIVYTRIRAMGHAQSLGADRLAAVADQLAGRRECFVIIDAQSPLRIKNGLKAALEADAGRRPAGAIFRPDAPFAGSMTFDDEEQ
jgi:uncharacterized protein YecE (DUF72 family)